MSVASRGIPLLPAEARQSAPLPYQLSFLIACVLLLGAVVAGVVYNWSVWRRPPGIQIDFRAMGDEWSRQQRWDLAAKEYRSAKWVEPHDIMYIKETGAALAKAGDLDGELETYLQAYKLMPNNADVHHLLSRAYFQRNELNASVYHAHEALLLNPDFAWPHATLAGNWVLKGNLEAAQEEFVEAIRLDPDFFQAYMGLGVVLTSRGDIRMAEKCFGEAVSINPNDARAQEMLAQARDQLRAYLNPQGMKSAP